MATYAIGDVQGCFDSLQLLLERIAFDPGRDRLWLAGDLVNRGPKSLQVLRWARSLGDRVTVVLGNHDLHLLLRAAGAARKKKRDTLAKVLNAHDRVELIDWLRHQPLLHVEDDLVMVHAGLHPSWSVPDAVALADEVCAVLRGDDWQTRIADIPAIPPPAWADDLAPVDRLRAVASVLLRLRACTAEGRLCHDFAGPPGDAPPPCTPWFRIPGARWRDHRVLFGHWSALGLYRDPHCTCLDTGCVWNGQLTALRLEDDQIFQVPSAESYPPDATELTP